MLTDVPANNVPRLATNRGVLPLRTGCAGSAPISPHAYDRRLGYDARMGARIARLCLFFGLLVLLASIVPWVSDSHWTLDLFSHFRIHYLTCGMLLALVGALAGGSLRAMPAAMAAVINAVVLASLPRAPFAPADAQPRTGMTVAHFNVHTVNRRFDDVVAWIRRSDADVVFILEADRNWARALRKVGAPYRVVVSRPRSDNFGMVAVARVPVDSAQPISHPPFSIESIEMRVQAGGRTWTVLGVHPPPPIGDKLAAARDAQLAWIDEWAKTTPPPYAVTGDLNATPFSAPFRRLRTLLRASDLGPSWPYSVTPPAALLRISIDHTLVGPDVEVRATDRGPAIGSDHRPLVVHLVAGSTPSR